MKKLLITILLSLVPLSAFGQLSTSGTITASGAGCGLVTNPASVVQTLYNSPQISTGAATITLAGGFSATVQFYASNNGGLTWASIFGTPSAGGTTLTSATAAGTWTFSVSSYTHLCALASAFSSGPLSVTIQASANAIAAGGLSNLGGGAQGQAVVCTSATNCIPSPQPFFADAFPAATDPCNAINLAFIASGNGQTNVDAQGLVSLAATPCTFQTANFFANSGSNGGKVLLPGVNMWVPLVPSNYGCLNALNTCVNGPNPPPGVIVIPNKTRGLEGLGRDNSGIYVCAATQTGKTCTGANAPVIRQWPISSTSITSVALLAYGGGSATGHRYYITFNTTGDVFGTGGNVTNPGTVTVSSAVANGTHYYVTVTATVNMSGVMSAGQPVTFSNFSPAGYNGSFTVGYGNTPSGASTALPFPSVNGSGGTVFTVDVGTSAPGSCTTCTGNVTVGFNVIPGEHVLAAGSSVINNNFTWRVCGQSGISGGAQQDPNCPAWTLGGLSFSVVGTSSDQKFNNAGAQTSTACASSCGTLFGEIPVIDYGSNPTNFQFNMMVRGLTISCNAVPSCVNARSMTGNEESGMEFTLMNGSPMWCMDFWTTLAEDSQSWHDLECIAGPTLVGASALSHITAGSTGFIVNESAMRAMRGATSNFNSNGLTPAGIVGTVPSCGMLIENTSSTWLSDYHSEGFQFNRCYGIGSPSQGFEGKNNGGQAAGSCGNRVSANGPGCGAMDGPFTYKTTLNGALASTGITSIPVTAATAAQCQYAAGLPTGGAGFGVGMLVSIGGIGAADLETVQITAATSGNTLTTTATSNTHSTLEPVFCSWSATDMVSGNFPTAIQGGQSGPWTGDYDIGGIKKNTGAVLTMLDDYSGCISNDNSVMHYIVDTSTSGGPIQRNTSSINCSNLMGLMGSSENASAAGTAANPSVVTFATGFVNAAAGAFSCSATASTGTCVVNTTAVTANSRVQITPVASSPGLTCNATADTPTGPRVASVSAGASFTINLGSFTTTPECFNFSILN